jgi:hypothetical protein
MHCRNVLRFPPWSRKIIDPRDQWKMEHIAL